MYLNWLFSVFPSVRLIDEQTEMAEKFLRFVETCLNRLKRPMSGNFTKTINLIFYV